MHVKMEKMCVGIISIIETIKCLIRIINVFKTASYRAINFGCALCTKSTSVQLNATTRPKWIDMLQSAS